MEAGERKKPASSSQDAQHDPSEAGRRLHQPEKLMWKNRLACSSTGTSRQPLVTGAGTEMRETDGPSVPRAPTPYGAQTGWREPASATWETVSCPVGPSQQDTGSRDTSQNALQKERMWTAWMGPSEQKEAGNYGCVQGRTMNWSPQCAQGIPGTKPEMAGWDLT